MVHEVRHVVALKGRLFLAILRVVLRNDEPFKHVKVALSLEQCLVHLMGVLH